MKTELFMNTIIFYIFLENYANYSGRPRVFLVPLIYKTIILCMKKKYDRIGQRLCVYSFERL